MGIEIVGISPVMAVDPLTEVITLLQSSVRSSKFVEGAGPWRIQRTRTGDLFFCAVLEGRCCVTVEGRPTMALRTGDFMLVPAMSNLVAASPEGPEGATTAEPIEVGDGRYRVGRSDGPADLSMRIGHCRLGSPDAGLLVALLPEVVVAHGEARFATLMQLVGEETHARRLGRDAVLQRFLEVLLIEALRSGDGTLPAPGLARGLADDRLAAALHAVHAHPERPWTVAELAAEAALSRSAFFARFSRMMGLKPMEYVVAWRMALARRLLSGQEIGVDAVAARVGYSSASTFSVAFARHTGVPPARYGRMQLTVV